MIKEACIENFAEAFAVQTRGASRVELCENLAVGGTTPSYGTIRQCVQKLQIPAFVMIRPRGGDFVYSEEELEIMRADIEQCKTLGVPAIVLGLLTADNKIDIAKTRELIALAHPMQVTFHKAFDEVSNYRQALEDVIQCGAHRILTSGTKQTALEGCSILNELIELAQGRITIVAAGKVTLDNVEQLSQLIHTSEFHGKKIV